MVIGFSLGTMVLHSYCARCHETYHSPLGNMGCSRVIFASPCVISECDMRYMPTRREVLQRIVKPCEAWWFLIPQALRQGPGLEGEGVVASFIDPENDNDYKTTRYRWLGNIFRDK